MKPRQIKKINSYNGNKGVNNFIKPALDVCCGSRMFYFNKNDPRTIFCDNRKENHILCDGRALEINPDIQDDFTNLPFDDETFYQISFDPPHLIKAGQNSWLVKKYGQLDKSTWQDDLRKGFTECFRVLKPNGSFIFNSLTGKGKCANVVHENPCRAIAECFLLMKDAEKGE